MEYASIRTRLFYQHEYQHISDFIGRLSFLSNHKVFKAFLPLPHIAVAFLQWSYNDAPFSRFSNRKLFHMLYHYLK